MDHPSIYNATILIVESQIGNSWIPPISNYLRKGTLPKDISEVAKAKARVARYTLISDTLYRRSFFGPYQRCVPPDEAKRIIEQVHKGICGTHIGGWLLCCRIMTHGFYWPMMKQESELFVRNCDIFQKFGNIIHILAMTLHSVSSLWPFYKWGIDIMGLLPLAPGQ